MSFLEEWLKNNIDNGARSKKLKKRPSQKIKKTVVPFQLRKTQKNECVYCGGRGVMTKDHILPKARGGKNHHTNYQDLCEPCNRAKAYLTENEIKYIRRIYKKCGRGDLKDVLYNLIVRFEQLKK